MTDRHQFRADWHTYNEGIYFITICCNCRRHYLGQIIDNDIKLSEYGKIVDQCIIDIPKHHSNVELLNYVIMPNHIHMVIAIDNSELVSIPINMGCLRNPRHGLPCDNFHFNSELAIVVRTFKEACSRLAGKLLRAQCIAPLQLWQRNYYEHIIRSQRTFDIIMKYIDSNVENWCYDQFNPFHSVYPSQCPHRL